MDFIDRDELIKRFCGHCIDYGKCIEKCFDVEIIESTPSYDVAPVIRCKDCKYYVDSPTLPYCKINIATFHEDGYCSHASLKKRRRKKNETD